MQRFAATAVVVLALVACGAGTDDPVTSVEPETTAPEPTEAATETSAAATEDGEVDGGDQDTGGTGDVPGIGTATVTIDGETTTFAGSDFAAETCAPDRFGIFFVVLQQVDDTGSAIADGLLEAVLLHDDTDAEEVGQDDRIVVTLGDTEWTADVAAGAGQVDDVAVDGATATATATFSGAGGTADGTLEITCAPAG